MREDIKAFALAILDCRILGSDDKGIMKFSRQEILKVLDKNTKRSEEKIKPSTP